ncbi:MAG: HEPN domain-containing protein [Cytophagaceae bacterium]|nr:HEPN domain-containing protein [Cytophagaceae bacterium]MBK9935411.1 HEPN domain-containing protein [Cytophagaceae bacterium]MBL0301852.1 HEPN domain-containing protein [Cytophagaceae bacterium]MBL0324678.1 HEPN domain-containing protein [Cytophagaceae bacterium]
MKNKVHLALERAIDCLSDTDIIIKNELNFASVNRAYYSVFYAISALLYSKDIFVKTHSGAISKFNELFIKESVFDLETAKSVSLIFEMRQGADYDLEYELGDKEAELAVKIAHNFINQVVQYFQKNPIN